MVNRQASGSLIRRPKILFAVSWTIGDLMHNDVSTILKVQTNFVSIERILRRCIVDNFFLPTAKVLL